MIVAYLGFFILIIAGGYILWVEYSFGIYYIETVDNFIPDALLSQDVQFMQAVLYGLPLIVIIGAIYWLIVYSQRTRPEGSFYV
jgi:hypothetical protein